MIRKALLIATLSLGFSNFAHADFVKVDFLTEGDGQSVLDTKTGKEWLNQNYTKGMTLSAVNEALTGELSGWRIAGLDEVLVLVENQFEIAGISHLFWDSEYIEYAKSPEKNTGTYYVEQSQNNARIFSETFGGYNGSSYGTYGMFVNDYKNEIGLFHSQYTLHNNNGMRISRPGASTYDVGNSLYGWWLVNDGGVSLSSINNPELNVNNPEAPINDVSAPILFGSLAISLLGFSGLHRKNVGRIKETS